MKRQVQIRDFRIRVSNLTREEGRRLGELVARQLSQATSEGDTGSRSINEITIRFRSDSRSIDRLATEVTKQIRRRLN